MYKFYLAYGEQDSADIILKSNIPYDNPNMQNDDYYDEYYKTLLFTSIEDALEFRNKPTLKIGNEYTEDDDIKNCNVILWENDHCLNEEYYIYKKQQLKQKENT